MIMSTAHDKVLAILLNVEYTSDTLFRAKMRLCLRKSVWQLSLPPQASAKLTLTSRCCTRTCWFPIADTLIRLAVSCIVVAATEYTIAKNRIQNVNMLDTAGQLIPFVLGIAGILRIFYKATHVVQLNDIVTDFTNLPLSGRLPTTPPPHPTFVNTLPTSRFDITLGSAGSAGIRRPSDFSATRRPRSWYEATDPYDVPHSMAPGSR